MKLSAVVICKNEESSIAKCLESLRFCDEIIVVDSESTDNTVEIARAITPHVHIKPWTNFSAQKNYANTLAKNDWILSLDADEEVSPELRAEIQALLTSEPPASAYSIPRRTLYGGRWIRHGGWYPNRLVRLFNRKKGSWIGDELHERWECKERAGECRQDIIHHSFRNIADQVDRNNLYSTLGARHLQKRQTKFSLPKLLLKPIFKFLETYILKRGFLDGYPGFIISISAAYSIFLRWAKLWELEKCHNR